MQFTIVTFGCQMNERDSRALANILVNQGYNEVSDPSKADILIINTCTVRQHAEDRAISNLGRFLKDKKHQIIGLMGCVAERRKEELIKRFDKLDFVVGPSKFEEIPRIIDDIIKNRSDGVVLYGESEPHPAKWGITEAIKGISSWVTIMTGCDNYCSYCIVPYVRGRMRSLKEDIIYKELENLQEAGYKEATLLGQNVNAYGRDLNGNRNFTDLLIKIDKEKYLKRIRFVSSHPAFVDDYFIDNVTALQTICPHYHLPLQSGDNSVLFNMNRKYTIESFFEKVEKLRKKRPNCSITSDLIVGLPTEDDKSFSRTLEFIKRIRFDSMHTFAYSKREATAAYKFGDTIPFNIKKQRLKEVNKLQQQISLEINNSLIGKIVEVLIEGPSPKNKNEYQGRTETNKIVIVKSEKNITGEIVDVMIERAGSYTLFGKRDFF
ncbi:MAG: tRNA (N6-isopentenyl adenosine(37)-C2)-methylthiotransferase MiaB [Candidatus Hydrogenedentota bacterium]